MKRTIVYIRPLAKALTLSVAALTLSSAAFARRMVAADAVEFRAVARYLRAGDTVLLKSGLWRDALLSFSVNATADAPVTVMAEQAGETVFTGASKLEFSGENIIVEGLWFKDIELSSGEVIAFRTRGGKAASYCTLRNCAVSAKGLPQSQTDYKWVSLYGHHNTVENCSLVDKANMGCMLVVWFEEGVVPCHKIVRNYFSRPRSLLDDKGESMNGQEIIRIGTSTYSMQDGCCTVEGNHFYRCNGETETISNKSCRNVYKGNLFTECRGTLTLRHGNGCTVEGNAFFGGGAESTGGIRLIGEDHRVFNNYLQDLTGRGFYSAISLVQGEPDTAINGYFAAKNCSVVNNTVYNCFSGLNINHTGKRNQVRIENNTIANNLVVNVTDDKKAESVKVSITPQAPLATVYAGNIVWGGKIKGVEPSEAAITEADPALRRIGGYYVPVRKTYLDRNRVDGFDFVTEDIAGTPRGKKVTCGAFEPVGKLPSSVPTADGRGVNWKMQ